MTLHRLLAAGALALAALCPTAHAVVLAADGQWAGFTVDGNLPPYSLVWVDDNAAAVHFTFDVAVGFQARLTVVDAGFSGDRFSVSNHGVVLGSTSVPVAGDPAGAIEFDYDNALADANFSRGTFMLGAGSHDITGLLSQSLATADGPLDATIGAVRLDISPVPEPATLATLLAGLSLLTVWLRRRNPSK